MAYLTRTEAIRAARARFRYRDLMEAELRKSAHSGVDTYFDIFLSHSYEDAEVIAGVAALLEADGLTVYVDWLEDPQLDRSQVTPATARHLRTRMDHCGFLLYASSKSAIKSKWMPWELGYFDGHRPQRVGILPIVTNPLEGFTGVEYLGLYPTIERIEFQDLKTRFGRYSRTDRYGARSAATLKTLAQG
jgi:hypothetical protein